MGRFLKLPQQGAGGQGGRRTGRGLTSEVALLGEGDPQVAVLPAEAVGEEGREGGPVLPQELSPPGQPLQCRAEEMWASGGGLAGGGGHGEPTSGT